MLFVGVQEVFHASPEVKQVSTWTLKKARGAVFGAPQYGCCMDVVVLEDPNRCAHHTNQGH